MSQKSNVLSERHLNGRYMLVPKRPRPAYRHNVALTRLHNHARFLVQKPTFAAGVQRRRSWPAGFASDS